MMSMYHYLVLDDYLSDLKISVDFVSKKKNLKSKLKAKLIFPKDIIHEVDWSQKNGGREK